MVKTDAEGIRSALDGAEPGLLAECHENVEETPSELCVELIPNTRGRRQVASAGTMAVVNKFSIQRMQRELESLYEHVLGGPAQGISTA